MVELVVVLVIIGIIAAIAIPSAIHYIRIAQFNSNEQNAKTAYMAAESVMTYYRNSGKWEEFSEEIKDKGTLNTYGEFGASDKVGRIYAVTLDADTYGDDTDNPVYKILDKMTYDKSFFKGAIALEVDVATGEVYSAFYATKCRSLNYNESDGEDSLTMNDREYKSRRKRLLGYYSAKDLTSHIDLEPKKLKVTSVHLVNGETLALNWSGNSAHQSLDTEYDINFYLESDKSKLFRVKVDLGKLIGAAYDTHTGMAELTVETEGNGSESGKSETFSFPLTVDENGMLSLVLDGMTSARVQDKVDKASDGSLDAKYNMSITRLRNLVPALATQKDIYATISARCTYQYNGDDLAEYRDSNTVTSNVANSLFADGTADISEEKKLDASVTAFRHLSNIRYVKSGTKATDDYESALFTLKRMTMDWQSAGTGVYDFKAEPDEVNTLAWRKGGATLDFPSIPMLKESQTLEGEADIYQIKNLKLGKDSVAKDEHYIGLFREIEGTIQNFTVSRPFAEYVYNNTENAGKDIYGIGTVAGRMNGKALNVSVSADAGARIMNAVLDGSKENASIGGVFGVLKGDDASNGSYTGDISDITVEGRVDGTLNNITYEQNVQSNQSGTGGVAGSLYINNNPGEKEELKQCSNHADVYGNGYTGGIIGRIKADTHIDIKDCNNLGLTLSNTDGAYYFGGIIGYAQNTHVTNCYGAAGLNSGYSFDAAKKEEYLLGNYVGGILGFGEETCTLEGCFTGKNGYVLGKENVGGIAGSLASITNSVNASYVIGYTYVGGIIGENNQYVENCVNNGIAAGYDKYIGGIVGYNDNNEEDSEKSVIKNCASYISDYDKRIYNRIVNEWKAYGSYSGGLAGYNNGNIIFDDINYSYAIKAVSSIVVGNDFVGGFIGFNDVDAHIDVKYALLSGDVYGFGDCVGGLIGMNTSVPVLGAEVTVRPSSVTGKNCVGGAIGANIIKITNADVDMSGYKVDNTLGSITGEAYCGGVIGYNRHYSDIKGADGTDMSKVISENKDSIIPSLSADKLPYIKSDKIIIKPSKKGKLIISDGNNDTINNIPIHVSCYGGGVVGYCDDDSLMVIRNCHNAGSISKASGERGVVSVPKFIESRASSDTGINLNSISSLKSDMVGGIVGVNLPNHVVDGCSNSGNMSGFTGLGGVVGLNMGRIFDCSLTENFGNAGLSYIGGIAGINVNANAKKLWPYTTVDKYNSDKDCQGTIKYCTTVAGKTISGKNCVGGITGYNLDNALLEDNISNISINAVGNIAGGIAGRNAGIVHITKSSIAPDAPTRIYSRNGENIGGLVGQNESTGLVRVSQSGSYATEGASVIAVNSKTSVTGLRNVGGMIGNNMGTVKGDEDTYYLVSAASEVHAYDGYAGGIAGISSLSISNAVNSGGNVTADKGYAGGIVSHIPVGMTVSNCKNWGSVISSSGNAGGIAAENHGIIDNCMVSTVSTNVTIKSLGCTASGAVCAVNYGEIYAAEISKTGDYKVTLSGDSQYYGGVAGWNQGKIDGRHYGSDENAPTQQVSYIPEIESSVNNLIVGGVTAYNYSVNMDNSATVTHFDAKLIFSDVDKYYYLGGITGKNDSGSVVEFCTYAGEIHENNGQTGTCYGGITGYNGGTLTDCELGDINFDIQGAYTANSTNTAAQKEAQSSHLGGIAGKNEENALIQRCYLNSNASCSITAANGMLGGVTGYNKGTIEHSGDIITKDVMENVNEKTTTDELCKVAAENEIKPIDAYVGWKDNDQIENRDFYYNGNWVNVSAGRLKMMITNNGNIGGITAYNSPVGELEYCVTGKWFINNKSESLGVGTGGIAGINETEKNMQYLVNRAFVGRQLSSNQTNRFAGGIIGNQNNSTTENWTIKNCVNYGMVYCYQTHYSGGIMGQWTGNGGTIEGCRNYANLQTTYGTDWVGASAGIVAQLYHARDNQDYNIIKCDNYGSIYTQYGEGVSNGANDSAGILGNVTAYAASNNKGQQFTIRVLDCTNGAGVEIYSASMASGIVGFFSSDDTTNEAVIADATCDIKLYIERCRNFATKLRGSQFVGGIFGDRYGQKNNTDAKNTTIKDCYSVTVDGDYSIYNNNSPNHPIISYVNSHGYSITSYLTSDCRNYYFDNNSWFDSFNSQTTSISSGDQVGQGQFNVTGSNDWSDIRAGGRRVYVVKDASTNEYVLADFSKENFTLNGAECRIDNNTKEILDKDNETIGKILCTLDEKDYKSVNEVLKKDPKSNYETYVRGSYRFQNTEGIDDTGKKLLAPESAEVSFDNGKAYITVKSRENYDPFRYRVKITIGDNVYDDLYIYEESGRVPIPSSDAGGDIKVSVCAESMYDDIKPSDYIEATADSIAKILPAPDIRLELVWMNSVGFYRYRVLLENLDAYKDFSDWTVSVKVAGISAELTKNSPVAYIEGIDFNTGYQMISQASSKETGAVNSSQVSETVVLPKYNPKVGFFTGWGVNEATASVTTEGNTIEDLSVIVKLKDTADTANDYMPVYRAELIGTWKKGTKDERADVVFGSTDILLVSRGTATGVIDGFSDYLKYGSDFKVRILYASSGAGPVYAYYEWDDNKYSETQNASTFWAGKYTVLTGVDDDGNAVFKEYATPVLIKNELTGFRKTIEDVLTLLDAPVFDTVPDNTLVPEYDPATGELYYTIGWDKELSETGLKYRLSMVGITEDEHRVVIDTSEAYNESNPKKLRINAEDWNFKEVEISATRIGSGQQVGVKGTWTYKVKQRLEEPGQPIVSIVSNNELFYDISWPAIAETGCVGYQAYLQKEDGTVTPIDSVVTANGSDMYSVRADFEDYAGKKLSIYVVAKARENGNYVDSAAGIRYEMTLPERIATPAIDNWSYDWTYDANSPTTIEGFHDTGLLLTIEPHTGSIPPAGSAYVMKAEIFEDAEGNNKLGDYPAASEDGIVIPVQMDAPSGTGNKYKYFMSGMPVEYAGKFIKFHVRISSGASNVSSAWKDSDIVRLPYVKLNTPLVQASSQDDTLKVDFSTLDGTYLTSAEWTANRKSITWTDEDYADSIYFEAEVRTDGANKMTHRFRVNKAADAATLPTVEEDIGGTWSNVPVSADNTWILSSYTNKLNGGYLDNNYKADMTATLLAVWDEETKKYVYTLQLPDAYSLTMDNGEKVDNEHISITTKVEVWADVTEDKKAYFIKSEPYTVTGN